MLAGQLYGVKSYDPSLLVLAAVILAACTFSRHSFLRNLTLAKHVNVPPEKARTDIGTKRRSGLVQM